MSKKKEVATSKELIRANLASKKVYVTTDYSMFNLLVWNRCIDPDHVQKIANQIIEVGQFTNAMTVDQNYNVIDGQHRLKAAEKVNSEVSFVMINATPEELPRLVSHINSVGDKWSLEDFLHMWSKLKKSSYIYLKKLYKKYEMQEKFGIRLCGYTFKKQGEVFREGKVELTEEDKINFERYASMYRDIKNIIKNHSLKVNGALCRAIINMVKKAHYNHDYMVSKLSKYIYKLKPNNSTRIYGEMLSDIYNYGLSANRIKF